MRRIRVIPSLLLRNGGLVKSRRFKDHVYVGDPINVVRIFNQKEVDELAVIDIDATRDGRGPDMERISEIVSEAFIPIAYGGGISNVDQVKEILFRGVEKVIINKAAVSNPGLITAAASQFGSQSIVVSIDVKKAMFKGQRVFTDNGKTNTGLDPVEFARSMEKAGAGELLLQSIDREGSYEGYDLPLVEAVSRAVSIPVIAAGGASSVADFRQAVEKGASALSAGSMFVFQRPHNAVLISYPSQTELKDKLYAKH
ncbi:AglZ/HisF2 family acetamidino modification protein [Puia sp. P3]|jgi:cyclase|uniref:AglZ/HisF2 family acetamidino modification protein n=1 Tax=Puia sp. P3 TaxID=3423952 RepID=UPI003D6679F9